MAQVNFVGLLESCVYFQDAQEVSVTWAIVPGNNTWNLNYGSSSGETHVISTLDETGKIPLDHPIDVEYITSSVEGWPFFVCEVWEKAHGNIKSFLGCGCAWVPLKSGKHTLDINLWLPSSKSIGYERLTELFLPTCPDLKALRELVVNPYMRSQVQTDTVGNLRVQINVVTNGFDLHGVSF